MKTLIAILTATVVLTSCTKTNPNCVFESDCKVVIESDFATHKFLTKKEFKEKDAQLFKVAETNLFN